MDDFSLTLIWLGFFASIFFGWYFYLQARNKERMALIEKNADVTEIYKTRGTHFKFPWLKFGTLVTGVGLGFCIALFVGMNTNFNDGDLKGIMIFGFMLLFGGLGAVVGHFLDKPKNL